MENNSKKNHWAFVSKYGEMGEKVLNAWDTVDPLESYNKEVPDEYVSYAIQFIELWAACEKTKLNDETKRAALLEECVRRSFHPTQIVDSEIGVSPKQIKKIASMISKSF